MRFTKPGFQFGLDRPLFVREEIILQRPNPYRLVFISDIHLRRGRSPMLSGQIIEALERARPDVILLGGDLIDQSSELGALQSLLARMGGMAPVLAIPGNHDLALGASFVREAALNAGAKWIEDETVEVLHDGRTLAISGPGAKPGSRADVRILCAHNPRIWKTAKHAGFDLVLAGHLHGCQGVLFETGGRLFPGALFYPHNHIRQSHHASRLVVSMGCSDLIPVRWGCPREIVVCAL